MFRKLSSSGGDAKVSKSSSRSSKRNGAAQPDKEKEDDAAPTPRRPSSKRDKDPEPSSIRELKAEDSVTASPKKEFKRAPNLGRATTVLSPGSSKDSDRDSFGDKSGASSPAKTPRVRSQASSPMHPAATGGGGGGGGTPTRQKSGPIGAGNGAAAKPRRTRTMGSEDDLSKAAAEARSGARAAGSADALSETEGSFEEMLDSNGHSSGAGGSGHSSRSNSLPSQHPPPGPKSPSVKSDAEGSSPARYGLALELAAKEEELHKFQRMYEEGEKGDKSKAEAGAAVLEHIRAEKAALEALVDSGHTRDVLADIVAEDGEEDKGPGEVVDGESVEKEAGVEELPAVLEEEGEGGSDEGEESEPGRVVDDAAEERAAAAQERVRQLKAQNEALAKKARDEEEAQEQLRAQLAAFAARQKGDDGLKAKLLKEIQELQKTNSELEEKLVEKRDAKDESPEGLMRQVSKLLEEKAAMERKHREEAEALRKDLDALSEEKEKVEEELAIIMREKESLDNQLASVSLRAASAANGSLRVANERRELVKESEELKRELAAAKAEIGALIDAKTALESEDWTQFAMRKWSGGVCGSGY